MVISSSWKPVGIALWPCVHFKKHRWSPAWTARGLGVFGQTSLSFFLSHSLSLYFCYWYVKFRYEKNWVFVRSLVKSLGTPAQHIKLKVCPCLPRSFEAHQGQSLRPSSSSPSWGMVGTMWNLNLLWWCFSRFGTWKAVGCKSRNQRPAAGGHG